MYIAVLIIVGLLIFPIITSLYFFVDFNLKKVFFAVFIFGKIKIISGYFKFRDTDSLYLHISNSKAIIIELSLFNNIKGNVSFLKIFNIDLVEFYIDLGLLNAKIITIIMLLYNNFIAIAPNLDLIYGVNSKLNVTFNKYNSFASLKLKVRFQFNLACIVFYIIANIISVGEYNVKRKKINAKKRNFGFT